jgi:hypothetical protein
MTSILRQAEGRRKAPALTKQHPNEPQQHQPKHRNVANPQAKPANRPNAKHHSINQQGLIGGQTFGVI